MNKRKWICLSVVLIVIILIASIVIKHWNSIEALIDSYRYSQEEVIDKLDENKKQLQQYIDENEDITVRDLTEEEAKALNEGNLTEEEAIKILTGQDTKEEPSEEGQPPDTDGKKPTEEKPSEVKPSETTPSEVKPSESKPTETKPSESAPSETKPEEKPASTAVSEAIAKLYIQKSKYLGKLDAIESQLYNDFYNTVVTNKLNESEMKAVKQQMINSNVSKVAAWENECDSVVYGILDEIKVALKAENQDTDIVKKLEEAYLNEKRLKKSYFINRYMD